MTAPTRARPAGCCPLEPILSLREDERAPLIRALRALADPTRLEIVRLLAAQPGATCVCDVVEHFELAQPTISHHLRVLEEAGLVAGERRGIWSYYAVSAEGVAALAQVLVALARGVGASRSRGASDAQPVPRRRTRRAGPGAALKR